MLIAGTTYRPHQESAGWTLVNWARIHSTKPKLLIYFSKAWRQTVMIMVEVFSALYSQECDIVGRVHDSSIEDGWFLASCPILTPLCAADALKWRKQQPILCVGTRFMAMAQLVLDWILIACGDGQKASRRLTVWHMDCRSDKWLMSWHKWTFKLQSADACSVYIHPLKWLRKCSRARCRSVENDWMSDPTRGVIRKELKNSGALLSGSSMHAYPV